MSSTTFCTILLTNSYLPGALVLASQLIEFHPDISRTILISNAISEGSKKLLKPYYDQIILVDPLLVSEDNENLKLFDRMDLKFTLSKIYIFNLSQFDKLIYFDADMLPLKPLDEKLLALEIDSDNVAGSPDASWPDIFNSGFMVLKPSEAMFETLTSSLDNSFDGADQGLFNESFTNWHRLPFLYNVTVNYSVNVYEYLPALNHFKDQIFNVHFIGIRKPWVDRDCSADSTGFFSKWWLAFNKNFTDLASDIFEAAGTISHPILVKTVPGPVPRGPEAEHFKDVKLVNKWDEEDQGETEQEAAAAAEPSPYPPPIFPWEQNRVDPTRTFGPDSEYLEPVVLKKLDDLDIQDKTD